MSLQLPSFRKMVAILGLVFAYTCLMSIVVFAQGGDKPAQCLL